MIWTGDFWKAALERMVRGFAIAAITVLGHDAIDAIGGVDWINVVSFGLGGAVLSLLFSLAGNATSGNGPSFTSTEAIDTDNHYRPRRAMPDDIHGVDSRLDP